MREREKQTEGNRGCGKLTMPLYKPPATDRQTDRGNGFQRDKASQQISR